MEESNHQSEIWWRQLLINIVGQGRLEIILLCHLDKPAKVTGFMKALARRAEDSSSISMSTAAFVNKHVVQMVEHVCFKMSL